ncbi:MULTISPECIES: hypothetical protein [Rhodococcus]|uniref:hypothetical protein n=1 Tax=Rhodococcus TaxID=1827 RepID=UPI0011115B20|nr:MULTISPECIES: hypothetical protein [Rhodococcus]WAL49130.1 hypothetical protein OQN32_25905 [Rhodococcus pyridinivorans]
MAVFNRTTRLRDPSVQRLAPRGPTRPTQPLEPQRREYRLSIVVASMAIAGTLLGSVSAGVFNLVNSSEQAEAAITQSNNEFWKAQRQQVYTDFLVVADQVSQFAGQLSQALNPEIPLNAEQREAAIMAATQPLTDHTVDLYAKLSAVQLLGSTPSRRSCRSSRGESR